jgi:hypothetical protein
MALSDYTAGIAELMADGVPTAATALATLTDLIARGLALAAALADAERGRTATIAASRTTVLALASDLGTFVDTYFADTRYPAELFLTARAAAQGCYQLLIYRRGFADAEGLTAGATPLAIAPTVDTRPCIPYYVRQGDTLERLALTYLGDVTRSWEIVDLNGLQYPFLQTE